MENPFLIESYRTTDRARSAQVTRLHVAPSDGVVRQLLAHGPVHVLEVAGQNALGLLLTSCRHPNLLVRKRNTCSHNWHKSEKIASSKRQSDLTFILHVPPN